MKRNIITALLITAMISTMTACGNKNTDTTTETVATTETTVTATEETATTEVATQDQIATLPMTDEDKPVVDATPSPDPKASDAPKTTEDPKSTAKPVVTATAKPNTQASATTTATTKPSATTAPKSTTAPTTAPKATTAPAATATPKATQAPAATAKPAANTPAPTAAPVACQHTSTHVENAHDSYQVAIAGGCYQEWRTATRVCNDCGANLGESQDRVGDVHHGCVVSEGVSATCTTDGRTAVESCDCGGRGTVGGDVIPAYGHSWHEEFDHSEETPNDDGISVTTKYYYHEVCYTCGETSGTYEK